MEAMEHGYGSCDLGFYQASEKSWKFNNNFVQRYKDASPGEREALANIDTL